MAETGVLLAFMAAALAITIVPGADMALVMGSAVGGGRRAGMAAVAGITLGAIAHVLASAVGLTALVVASPAILSALGWAGALYLIWIGVAILRSRARALPGGPAAGIRPARILRDALATNLLNPKAYLFMLAVFPQFIRPDGWAPWAQTGVLGLMLLSVSVPVYTAIALTAARAGTNLAGRPQALAWLNRISGLLLVGVGASALWSMAMGLLAG